MFHVELDSETTSAILPAVSLPLDDLSTGFFLGVMVGEGHFGGDGKQPQLTLRMHTRHERLFQWLERSFPGGRLYGPYNHGGRSYYQWMARGPYLREAIVPLFVKRFDLLDDHVRERFLRMCRTYRIPLPAELDAAQG